MHLPDEGWEAITIASEIARYNFNDFSWGVLRIKLLLNQIFCKQKDGWECFLALFRIILLFDQAHHQVIDFHHLDFV